MNLKLFNSKLFIRNYQAVKRDFHLRLPCCQEQDSTSAISDNVRQY